MSQSSDLVAPARPPQAAPQAEPRPPERFTRAFVGALYDRPLFALLDEARAVHKAHQPEGEVQLCTLLSVKTGGGPADCGYCPQSSHSDTQDGPGRMGSPHEVVAGARGAQ